MSEYKTLKEWFGDATRGDGRKFGLECTVVGSFFEPIFKDADGYWHGVNHNGDACCEKATILAKEWHPPKQKVKRWKWAFKNPGEHWQESTKFFDDNHADMQFPKDLCERKKLLYTETLFDE